MVVWWGFEFVGCSPFAFFYCDVHADFPFGCTVTFGRSLKVLGCASEMCVAAFLSEQTTVGSRHGFVGLIGWWHCWYHPTRNVCYAALFVQAIATNTDPIDPGRWRRLFHAGEVHVAPNASFCASRQQPYANVCRPILLRTPSGWTQVLHLFRSLPRRRRLAALPLACCGNRLCLLVVLGI